MNIFLNKLVDFLLYKRHIFRFQFIRNKLEKLAMPDIQPEIKQVNLQIVKGCNYRCSHCPQGLKQEKICLMDIDLFQLIVRKFKDINYNNVFTIYFTDEPSIRKDWIDLILYAAKELPNAQIHTETNGSLITKEDYQSLMSMPNVVLFIDTYGKKEVLDKVENWESKRCVVYRHKKPCSLWNWAGALKTKFKLPLKQGCLLPSVEFPISYDGKVRSCMLDYYSEQIIGDIKTQSVMEIWNSFKWRQLRFRLKNNQRSGICAKCDYFGSITHFNKVS